MFNLTTLILALALCGCGAVEVADAPQTHLPIALSTLPCAMMSDAPWGPGSTQGTLDALSHEPGTAQVVADGGVIIGVTGGPQPSVLASAPVAVTESGSYDVGATYSFASTFPGNSLQMTVAYFDADGLPLARPGSVALGQSDSPAFRDSSSVEWFTRSPPPGAVTARAVAWADGNAWMSDGYTVRDLGVYSSTD